MNDQRDTATDLSASLDPDEVELHNADTSERLTRAQLDRALDARLRADGLDPDAI